MPVVWVLQQRHTHRRAIKIRRWSCRAGSSRRAPSVNERADNAACNRKGTCRQRVDDAGETGARQRTARVLSTHRPPPVHERVYSNPPARQTGQHNPSRAPIALTQLSSVRRRPCGTTRRCHSPLPKCAMTAPCSRNSVPASSGDDSPRTIFRMKSSASSRVNSATAADASASLRCTTAPAARMTSAWLRALRLASRLSYGGSARDARRAATTLPLRSAASTSRSRCASAAKSAALGVRGQQRQSHVAQVEIGCSHTANVCTVLTRIRGRFADFRDLHLRHVDNLSV